MSAIVLAMIVIVVIAAAVVFYVAFPHRGEDLPGAGWLGDAMNKAVDALPTVEDGAADAAPVSVDDLGRGGPAEHDAAHR